MTNDPSSLPQIDLNQADVQALTTLPGIGPKLAERIIRYREEVQFFEETVEITAVPGISEKIYRQFADRVTVSLPDSGIADVEDAPVDEGVGVISEAEAPEVISGDQAQVATPQKPQPEKSRRIQSRQEEVYIIQPDQQKEPDVAAEAESEEDISTSEAQAATPQESQPDKSRRIQSRQEEVYIIQADQQEEEPVIDADLEDGYILSPEEDEDKSGFRRPWLLMLVGALLGTFLTLLLLYIVNGGTLVIANHPKIVGLEDELSTLKLQEAPLSADIEKLQTQVQQFEVLSTRLQNTEAEIQILKQARDRLAGEVESIQEETSAMATRVVTLDEQAGTLSDQVATLEEDSAEVKEIIDELQTETGRFDDFLTKLRDLLLVVQGEPEALPESPTVSPTDVTGTPEASPTPTRTPTPTPTPAS